MKAEAFVCIPHVKDKGTAVDVEILPLVLCRDCRKRNTIDCALHLYEGFCADVGENWFCADGERKRND